MNKDKFYLQACIAIANSLVNAHATELAKRDELMQDNCLSEKAREDFANLVEESCWLAGRIVEHAPDYNSYSHLTPFCEDD